MKLSSLRHTTARLMQAIMVTIAALGATSCQSLIYEDLDPCEQGLRLRFIYDYNMEFANAFPAQVDCLTLLVYDGNGKYLMTKTVTDRALLGDENWRMTLDLPAGNYRLLAYGGMECQNASFSFLPSATVSREDLQVQLNPNLLTSPVGKPLHHLFYGALDITVPASRPDSGYTEGTVEMMKDTNDLRIILANVEGLPTNEADFDFNLITDNTLLNSNNDIIPTALTTYCPWSRGNIEAGLLPSGLEATMAYAEISTSRFVNKNPTTLLITRKSDGKEIVKVPLINILLLYKSDRYASMPAQEFLDRESRWNITFFLTGKEVWLRAQIVVNDWIVRINNAEL